MKLNLPDVQIEMLMCINGGEYVGLFYRDISTLGGRHEQEYKNKMVHTNNSSSTAEVKSVLRLNIHLTDRLVQSIPVSMNNRERGQCRFLCYTTTVVVALVISLSCNCLRRKWAITIVFHLS